MKCSYHPATEAQELCDVCRKPLCAECAHRIKGKPFCQDCLVQGAEWAATVKGMRLPADAPKRAALCAIIPGMGAVYNGEYMKAITFFAVFAALSTMGDHGIFGFASVVFVIFTMFEAYRTAEAKARKRFHEGHPTAESPDQDKTLIGWGILLIALGLIFLLQNLIPFDFMNRLWPVVFILIGGFLVYRALNRAKSDSGTHVQKPKEGI